MLSWTKFNMLLWQMKNDTLAGFFGFVGTASGLTIVIQYTQKPLAVLTKAMQIRPIRRRAAFLHNVIIVHPLILLWAEYFLCTIMQHYVKKLGRKNYWHKSRSVRIIVSIIVTVIFLGALDLDKTFFIDLNIPCQACESED